MNNIHIIYVPMTGVGLYGGYRGDDWYRERIEIFKNWTLKSLQSQTSQNFVLWMSFRPQEQSNPLTGDLANYMKSQNIRYILTFDGLMYYDDKFTNGFKNKSKNIGRVLRDYWRNNRKLSDVLPAIKEVYVNKNSSLRNRLASALLTIKDSFSRFEPELLQAHWVSITRLDSDDLFHKQAVEMMQSIDAYDKGAMVCRKGLIYNQTTKEMAEWNPPTNPPFHTIFFPIDTFFTVDRHMEYMKGFTSHEDIPKLFSAFQLPDLIYCVTTHNPKNHISTIWDHPFRGNLVDP